MKEMAGMKLLFHTLNLANAGNIGTVVISWALAVIMMGKHRSSSSSQIQPLSLIQ